MNFKKLNTKRNSPPLLAKSKVPSQIRPTKRGINDIDIALGMGHDNWNCLWSEALKSK